MVCVDLTKMFDSVHRETLLDLERFRGILVKIIDVMPGLSSSTENTVKGGEGVRTFFF